MTTARHPLAAASAATVLVLGGLYFGTSTADAADAPLPGTAECTALVDADAMVLDATENRDDAAKALNLLGAGDPGFTAAQKLVVDAGVKLDAARVDASVRLCAGPDETPTTTPPPTTTTPPVHGDERDCSDFADRAAAQAFYDAVTTPGNPDPSRLDLDGDTVACEAGEGSGDGRVDPRADDGSRADTDGSQVIVVPEGSAATGAA